MSKTSWARKQIGLLQTDVQRRAIETALLSIELNLRPESNTKVLQARESLREHLLFLNEARKVIEVLETRSKMPWSDLVVSVYLWATAERLSLRE